MRMQDTKHWVALNMVLGVGKTLFHRLVHALGSPEAVLRAPRRELMRVEGVGEKIAGQILDGGLEERVEREFRLVEKLGARILTLESPEYPALLKEIYDPPPLLYCQGKPIDTVSVPMAVVGTRNPTNYGTIITEKLCHALAERGVTVVSGMARGIDTRAHRAALKAGGDTLAVFGCGLSQTYPAENASLRKKIVAQGAVISEFPVGMRPERSNFPARNRVISGLSHGTIVVEAGEKSGALITVQFALEQGRDVFAVPGNISSPKSRETNRLIKNGAKLVDGPEAVIEELPESIQDKLRLPAAAAAEKPPLTAVEQNLISLLGREEQHIDRIIENSRLSPAQVSATLVQLELKGWVRQMNGKVCIATTND